MTREQNNRLRELDKLLSGAYASALQAAMHEHDSALGKLVAEAATADPERLKYLEWQVRSKSGPAENIGIEIANVSKTADRMINGEALNIFAGGYRNTIDDIGVQIGKAGISTSMQMINRDALNAIYNAEHTALGKLPGYRGAFTQVKYREEFLRSIAAQQGAQPSQWIKAGFLRDRTRGNYFYNTAIGRLGDNADIVRRLQNHLAEAIILGESIPQIATRIRSVTEGCRRQAVRIARTETMRALNQGKHLAALQAAEEYDIPMKKQWIATLDDRTRDIHSNMHEVTVELEEPFKTDLGELQYPGDPNGEPANVINCRCTDVHVVDIEALKKQRVEAERESGIINAGATSGAHNPDTPEAEAHAKQYYESVRHMKTDHVRIAENTEFTEQEILDVKNYLFVDKHNLTEGFRRFDPDYDIAQSWQRLIDGGNIQDHDILLLKHEIMEMDMVKRGITQMQAHEETSHMFNYVQAVERWRR
jgi:hypothetical protein